MEGNVVPTDQTWTDYDGDTTYGDHALASGNPPTATNLRSYQPGLAEVDEWVADGNTNTTYLLTDHLGTVRSTAIYTAFGERISGDNPRFGYVGSYGYQSHSIAEASNPDTAFPFLHVGARYYDPASGRFLQRDPSGVLGGLNVYAYARGIPTRMIDPQGLDVVDIIDWLFPPEVPGSDRPYVNPLPGNGPQLGLRGQPFVWPPPQMPRQPINPASV